MFIACLVLAGCSRGTRQSASEPEAAQGSSLAVIGLKAQEHFGMQVAPARRERLSEYLQVVGTVQPVNSRVAVVRPLARGRVLEVLAGVGDRVQAGQPLASLDNIEAGELAAQLAAARAELQRLRVQIAARARQVERSRRLADLGAMARQEYEQSRAEQEALEESARAQESVVAGLAAKLARFALRDPRPGAAAVSTVSAPFAGIVTRAGLAPGELVAPETELFTVADISNVWVQAEVYEKDLGHLRVGQPAIIWVDTYPDEPFHGKVTYISDMLEPQTRTAKVRCEVPNPAARLKLDMFATVQLPTKFDREVVAVPADAIQQIDGKDLVFVCRTPTQFEPREVQAGKVVNGLREIIAGLQQGEPIVTVGSFHVKSVLVGRSLGEE